MANWNSVAGKMVFDTYSVFLVKNTAGATRGYMGDMFLSHGCDISGSGRRSKYALWD